MSEELEPESPETAPETEPEAAGKPKRTRAKKAAPGAEPVKAKKSAAKAKAPGTRAKGASTKARKAKSAAEETVEAPAKEKTKVAGKKPAKTPAKKKAPAKKTAAAASFKAGKPFEDPIGDVTDGEGRTYTGEEIADEAHAQLQAEVKAYRAEAAMDAVDGTLESGQMTPEVRVEIERSAVQVPPGKEGETEPETEGGQRPAGKLERLQKILSQAGIASRRRAEEMIVEGRVVVNGQVVTALGSKADPERDHIRVDGKLLHGAERHRYFVLNKPRGYVTTVSDPEGRPTVMEFVAKLGERVYPVGRLDYQSEGLLLMTNDGELANRLTRAASGVEKTYLVKVAGQPSEDDLEKLRGGVAIERGQPGSGRVRTAPARVRQVRQGANPWFEVVLIEGRNRELRKMFGAVGHFVEKIRRVGYGPLILDLEPGKLRELDVEEVTALRLAAEGRLRPRRVKSESMLPKDAGRAVEMHPAKPYFKRGGPRSQPQQREPRPRGERPFRAKEGPPREFRGERREKPARPRFERPAFPVRARGERPAQQEGPRFERPRFSAGPRREREEGRREERPREAFRPRAEGPRGERPGFERRERPKKWTGRRPEEPGGKAPGRGFDKGPRKDWKRGPGDRPFRSEGGTPASRGEGRPVGGRSGGGRPGGFSKTGFQGKAGGGGGRRYGPRPAGKPHGGKRRG